MFINNKFYDKYFEIINQAKIEHRIKGGVYYETHHIIPKSFGGTNDSKNLVLLTGSEHYLCHCYLPLFTKGTYKDKMLYAWNFIKIPETTSGHNADLLENSKIYEILKTEHAKAVSRQFSDIPKTDEIKQAISEANSGKKNGMYGKKHSDKVKEKISNASKKRQSKENIKIITCPHCNKIGAENVMKRWHFDNCGKIFVPKSFVCPKCGKKGNISAMKQHHGEFGEKCKWF